MAARQLGGTLSISFLPSAAFFVFLTAAAEARVISARLRLFCLVCFGNETLFQIAWYVHPLKSLYQFICVHFSALDELLNAGAE